MQAIRAAKVVLQQDSAANPERERRTVLLQEGRAASRANAPNSSRPSVMTVAQAEAEAEARVKAEAKAARKQEAPAEARVKAEAKAARKQEAPAEARVKAEIGRAHV